MATDQSAPPTDDLGLDADDDTPAPPGIAHLTVVPANADRSS
ncbi:hypothetical protein [Haloarcula onubensis]|nr:hypothetical protein [Halomicroarcula sp. S3CR25-11]